MAGPLVLGTAATINSNGKIIQIYGNNSAVDGTNRFVRLSGVLSGAGTLNISQYGVAKLNALHTYTGQTQIDNGELWIEATGNVIAAGSAIYVGNGSQLTNVSKILLSATSGGVNFPHSITMNAGNASTRFLGGLNTSGNNTFSGTVTGTASDLNLQAVNAGGTTEFTNVISGSGAVQTIGSGIIKLSGQNTFTGAVNVNSGNTLQLGNAGSGANTPLGTVAAGTTVASGGTLDLNGYTLVTAEPLTITGSGVLNSGSVINSTNTGATYSGLVTLGGSATINGGILAGGTISLSNTGTITGTGDLTFGGAGIGSTVSSIIGITGSVVKNDAGLWTLSGINTYNGTTTVNAGTLVLSGNSTFTGAITVNSGGILKLGAAGTLPNSPLGTVAGRTTINSGGSFDLAGINLITAEPVTISGTGVSGILNAGAIMNTSTANASTFTGPITLAGDALINGGYNLITLSGGISGACNLTLGGGFGGTISGAITTGSLTKVDNGIWTLSNVSNTYTGNTTINAGTLVLSPANNITPASKFILNGGTLSTNGITANKTIISSSTLQLTNNSTISLNGNVHSLKFADCSAETWTGTLQVVGWTGTLGSSGTNGKLYFGSNASGLTSDQLSRISFVGYVGSAVILSTGEVVPSASGTKAVLLTGTIGSGSYTTLKAAFDDINNGVVTGAVKVQINGNLVETATSTLNGSQCLSAAAPTKVSGGSGYTNPTLVFGGGGTGASGTFTIGATSLATVNVVSGGAGYTSVPAVTISGTGGTGATATAVLAPTSIATITKTAAGSGYQTPPTISFSGGGSGATATVNLTATTLASIAVSAGGSGYTSAPTVILTGGGYTTLATATATVSGGAVTSIAVTGVGAGYTTPPVVAFSGGGGSGATANALLTASTLNVFTLTSGGSGYTFATPPTVVITPTNGGSGGTASITLTPTSVASVTVTAGGSGFTVMPTATIAPPSALVLTAAVATTTVASTSMNAVTIVNRGTGYTNPTLTISDPIGTGASYTMPAASTNNFTSVTVYPIATGKTITNSGSLYNITLSGASNVFIDGRLHDSSGNLVNGNARDLTISNNNIQSGGAGGVILFTNNAYNNTVSYCNLLGSTLNTTSANGMIQFGGGSGTSGNYNNTISYNLISNSTNNTLLTRPSWAILSTGTAGSPNTGNQILNNEFKDLLNPTIQGGYICLTGSTGLWVNTGWTISNNSFYETIPLTGYSNSLAFIRIGSEYQATQNVPAGTNYTITGNYLGGSAVQCGGTTPWTRTPAYNTPVQAFGILYCNFNTGGSNLIENNVISNILYSNYYGSNGANPTLNVIHVNGGNAIIHSNVIGAASSTGSLVYNYIHVGSGQTVGVFNGINIGPYCTGTVDVNGNIISSIICKTDIHNASFTFNGIQKVASAGLTTIRNNIIGNETVANSIDIQSSDSVNYAGNYANTICGINYAGTDVNGSVDSNIIANINNRSLNLTTDKFNNFAIVGNITGISAVGGRITNNIIHDLTTGAAIANNSNLPSISGINHSNYTPLIATGNTIYNLSNTCANFTGYVNGISIYNTANGNISTNTVSNNMIFGLSTANTSTGAKIYGISYGSKSPNVINNNIISLSTSYNAAVNGIWEVATMADPSYSLTMCYNTVSVSGTATTGAAGSFCSSLNTTNTYRTIKDNLFVNSSINTAATGKHTAFYVKTTAGGTLDMDYNDYYSTGSGAKSIMANNGTTDYSTMAAWRTATSKDANSVNVDPVFANASGTTAVSYLTNALMAGNPVAGITTDFGGNNRDATTPHMGAWESAYFISTPVNVSSLTTLTPTSSVTVVNGGVLTINQSTTINNIIVESGGQLTNASNQTLTATALNLHSDANGTGTYVDNGTSAITTANVQQYLTSGRNWYVSSPIGAATTGSLNSATTIFNWDEPSEAWITPTNGATLNPMSGYISGTTIGTGVVTFSGTLNTGTKSISLTRTEGSGKVKAGFNLVGNPYPSYVNWRKATKTNVGPTMWYRAKNSGNTAYVFDTYNADSKIGTNNNGIAAVDSLIPPMQAFWVQVAGNSTGSLTFDNTMRAHANSISNLLKVKSINNDVQKLLRLEVSNGLNSDEAIIVFNSLALNDSDSYDSHKMSNANPVVPEIYTKIRNDELAINGLSSINPPTELPLGFRTGQNNNFEIKATQMANFDSDTDIILRDNLLGTEQTLTDGSTYNFTSDAITTTDRFTIIFKSNSNSTDIKNNTNIKSISVYENANRQIVVNSSVSITEQSTVTVYNSLGQKLETKSFANGRTVLNKTYNSGVYLVSVTANGKTTTKKLIIN